MPGIHAKHSFEDTPSSRLARDYGGARKPVPKCNVGTRRKEGNLGTRPSLSLRGVAAFLAVMSLNVFAETEISIKTLPDGVVSVKVASAPFPEFQLFAEVKGSELESGEASWDESQQVGRIQRRFHTKDGQNGCTITQVLRRHETGLRWELTAEGTGGPWSAPLELHLRWQEPGTTQFWTAWSDPLQSNKGWNDPLVFQPLQDREWFYGAPPFEENTPHTGYCPLVGNTFCIPLAVMSNPAQDQAVSLILSPEDRLLDLTLRSAARGEVVFSHINHRLEQGKPFSFSADLVVHKADWRAALAWMVERYPQYFNPPNPWADELAGCGAYSSYEGPLDVEKFKRMAFRINWKASFDFPYMGMFLPPVKEDQERWRRFDVDSSGRLMEGKYTETSRAQMAEYAQRMESMGFHVLSYFNVTEFGTDIKGPETAHKDVPETDLWKNANDFLYGKIADGILYNASGGTWGTWGGAVAMDPAGPNYQAHLIAQARRHIEKIPASPGICIDRLDWLRFYNPREDDGVSWRKGKPCRSLFSSWRDISGKLSPMMHGADKVIFVNNHLKRIDLLREVDGIYCEFAQNGRALNATGLLTLRKPALGWTASEQDLKPDPDALFQRHLHMGVYPTAPLTGNDHTIRPSAFAEPYYLDYGPLLDALRGKKWVLQPHVIEVENNTAKANIFRVARDIFMIPVTFGGTNDNVRVVLNNLLGASSAKQVKVEVLYPGKTEWSVLGDWAYQEMMRMDVPLQRGCALLRLSAGSSPEPGVKVPGDVGEKLQKNIIWLASQPEGKQVYVAFRKTFDLNEKPASATLHLFADSRYILWINGQYVERGPCRFDPQAPEFDTLDVTPYVKSGANVIAAVVHHYHDGRKTDDPEPLNGRTMRHAPGFTALLTMTKADGTNEEMMTDSSWRGSAKARFLPSPVSWGNIPDNIDARIDTGDWTQADFDDSAWETPTPVNGALWGSLKPRSIPLLRETGIIPAHAVEQGWISKEKERSLESMLPVTLEARQELLLDVGQMVLAYDVLDMEADAGSELEVIHGHGYEKWKLDETYGSNRYIARAGRQTYMSGDTIGFRYMIIHVHSGKVVLHGVKVVNRLYPFERLGRFICNDAFLNELWERSVRTIQLCSEDGYVDCTARERTEWMGDSALSEYPVTRVAFATKNWDGSYRYSDPLLIRNMLRHIAQSQQPDGRMKAHHPSNRWDIHGYIEDYTCLWAQTLQRYYENTGDLQEVRALWPNLVKQLQWFLDCRTEHGLVKGREFVFVDNPLSYKECEGATLNAYVFGALNHAASLGEALGEKETAQKYRQEAVKLKHDFDSQLWDESKGAYSGGFMDGKKTEPSAFPAMTGLYFGIIPEERRAVTMEYLVQHRDQINTPYSYSLLFEVLYRADSPELDVIALNDMRERWASTLARKDMDTVFEGFGGPSFCHNIGASPAYYLSSKVLGVQRKGRLANNGIIIEPHLGDLESAEGVVVTELGPVAVSWKRMKETGAWAFSLDVPEGVQAKLALPFTQSEPAVTLDGKTLSSKDINTCGNRALTSVGPRHHTGTVN